MLEDRLTPAMLHWRGIYAGGFNNPNNWYGTQQNQPPQGNDDLYFGMISEGKTISCVVPAAFTFRGVHLISGYSGTVTLQDDTSIGTLELASGSIAQLGSSSTGYDLVVTERLAFTGGTLNNTSNTGVVHLTGTATQGSSSYVSSSTVNSTNLGSTLSVEGSGNNIAKLYFNGGVLNCFNGANVFIGEKGYGKSGPVNGVIGSYFGPNELKAVGNTVNPDTGVVTVRGRWDVDLGSPFEGPAIIVNGASATMAIKDKVTLSKKNTASFVLYDGHVTVDAGVTFKAELVQVSGGTFTTVSGTVTIDGQFQQDGGKLELGGSGNFIGPPVFGELLVKGDAILLAGGIDGAEVEVSGSNCDRITSTAGIKFGVGYTYTVFTALVAKNSVYSPFSAKDGFVFVDPTKLPIVAGYTASVNTVPGQPTTIQIKKN